MREKLCTYAQDQLPGGKYWDPSEANIRHILRELKPSNNLCESILGLNDYLTKKTKVVTRAYNKGSLKAESTTGDELSQIHLITTSEELQQALKCIHADESLSAAKKRLRKVNLLKMQIKIRKFKDKRFISFLATQEDSGLYFKLCKLHQIEYEDEEEHCYFDLTLDLLNGDLKVLN